MIRTAILLSFTLATGACSKRETAPPAAAPAAAAAPTGEHPGEHPGKPAAEHPGEHPGKPAAEHPGDHPGEHPGEHPGREAAAPAQPTVDEVRALVTAFAGDKLELEDHVLGGRWSLALDRIHPIRVIDADHWFACADLRGTLAGPRQPLAGEHVVDLDFYVNREGGAWKVARAEFHKLDGAERERPFVCPAHKDIACDHATSCPVCGATLVKPGG